MMAQHPHKHGFVQVSSSFGSILFTEKTAAVSLTQTPLFKPNSKLFNTRIYTSVSINHHTNTFKVVLFGDYDFLNQINYWFCN